MDCWVGSFRFCIRVRVKLQLKGSLSFFLVVFRFTSLARSILQLGPHACRVEMCFWLATSVGVWWAKILREPKQTPGCVTRSA